MVSRVFLSQATTIKLHPLYVMLPCTVAASLAFMLPVATPPNAIAFSYGNLKVVDMVRASRSHRAETQLGVEAKLRITAGHFLCRER